MYLNLNENFKRFEEGIEENKDIWNINRQLIPTQEHPRLLVD